MSKLLSALAWIAPQAAMRRAHALQALRYAGATAGRRGSSFGTFTGSANNAVGSALSKLRNRSHEMVRDHWAFSRILDVTVAHAVGTGITIEADNGSDRLDRLAQEAYLEWAATADVAGELDLSGLMSMQIRGMLEGGNSLITFVTEEFKSSRRRVPLKLCAMEGEHIDHSRDGMFESRRTRLGVVLGEYDKRLGYWLFEQNPTDTAVLRANMVPKFVAREDVIHLYTAHRAGQVLGVPVFAPVLLAARDHSDLIDALVMKAKIEACFAGFITKTGDSSPISSLTTVENGQRVTEFSPGMVAELREGEDIKFSTPGGGGSYDQLHMHMLLALAAGAGITYDQLTGDLRQANYSSLRAGKIEFRRMIEQLQWLTIVPKGYRRIIERWTRDAVIAGILRDRKEGYRWKYIMPANEPIDPKKDLEADILAVRSGRMSPQEFIAGYGRDWREVMRDFENFFAAADKSKSKLVFDIDPRKTNQIGSAQGDAAASPPAQG